MATTQKTMARERRRDARAPRACAARTQRPRLCVFRSDKHIYAQVISDETRQDAGRGVDAAAELRAQLTEDQQDVAARQAGRRAASRSCCQEQGHHAGRVRPQRLPLPRPRASGRRRRARSRPEVLRRRDMAQWVRAAARSHRDPRRRAQGEGRPHQPRRQGGEGRPALQLQRAGGRRRRQRPRRLRPRQGERSAGGDPQGHRARRRRRWSTCRSSTARSRTRCIGRFGAGHVLLRPASRRHRRDRRRRRARGGRARRRAQRAHQVPRLEQPAQHGARPRSRRCSELQPPEQVAARRGKTRRGARGVRHAMADEDDRRSTLRAAARSAAPQRQRADAARPRAHARVGKTRRSCSDDAGRARHDRARSRTWCEVEG